LTPQRWLRLKSTKVLRLAIAEALLPRAERQS
jgi:hypothetical protein